MAIVYHFMCFATDMIVGLRYRDCESINSQDGNDSQQLAPMLAKAQDIFTLSFRRVYLLNKSRFAK